MSARSEPQAQKPSSHRGIAFACLAVTILLATFVSGCQPREGNPAVAAAIQSWLLCTECAEGQLDTLVAFQEAAIPGLEDALIRGPTEGDLARFRLSLEDDYDRIQDRAARMGIDLEISRQDYVDTHESNLVAAQQIRAATALHAIGGEQARAALVAASGTGARGDVLALVGSLLGAW